MKTRKLVALALCLALLCPALASAEANAAITATDMTGREITLAGPATRVVALAASDCEILYALGAGGALVGRGAYCDYPAEIAAVPEVQSGYDTNIEQIIALEPQVVLMSKMAQTVEQVAALENAGIQVVVSDAQDINGVYAAILLIASLTGKSAEGEALVASMQSGFAEIAAAAASEGQTIYFEVSPLEYGLWTAGSGTFMNELAEMIGLTNAFADITGWAEVSEEQVIERDPDYIVTITMYYGEGATPEEEILSRDGWRQMKAIVSERVLRADANEISRPGPRLLNAAKALSAFVCGEAALAPAA